MLRTTKKNLTSSRYFFHAVQRNPPFDEQVLNILFRFLDK